NNATGSYGKGGGFYITSDSSPTITNCTIVNNTAGSNQGHEICLDYGTTNLRNTLIWNASTNAITISDSTVNYNNCAYPSATGTGNIALTAWNSPVSSDVKIKNVTHKVYKIFDNYSALQGIIGKGSHDIAPEYDQIGNAFANPPSIGAVEYVPPVLSVDISGDIEISTSYGTAKTLTFAPTVSLDNVALTTGYTVSWDIAVSPTASTISIDQSGKLTIGATTPAGSYDVTVKAQATYTAITTPVIKSNIAEKKVNITVESSDINLTLTSKDLPSGKVGTAYTEAEYFTATATPTTATLAWEVDGLPAGLNFDEGKISGTPTASGDFSVKVTVTATLTNYTTTSKDITASLTIEAADEQSGGGGSESSDITLTLTPQTLPNGKVGTAYAEAQYFTATATPSSADIAWEVEGLPAGLSFNKGKISGTPTASGDFSVKVTVTATLTNYTTTSKDITASLTIEAADEQSGGDEGGSGDDGTGGGGGSDDGETITVPSSGISGLTPTQKQTVKTLILNSVDDLSKITATDFPNLTSVKISSDVEVGNGGALDLSSLPATIKNFSISGNTSIKSLNLKASKVANIDASGCSELKSVDVSGNTSIITLDVSSTDIKLLDASNCSNLTSVDCSYCLLSELNVVACNALKSINCSHNSLLALDIPSGLTNLTSINCAGQVLYNWSPSLILNFDEFVQSYDKSASASSVVRVSATKLTNVKNLKAYDNNDKEIAIITSDDNGNITFASAPDTMKYDYEIGDINNTLMDVTVYSDGSSSQTNTLGSSGGGCNVMKNEGLILILLLFALVLSKLKVTRR
ncbi:MAG: putative Ig domain-containing protein, partial [Synergistaceae bacterium]|nr:putative Ig domain-containing protein [Synergistaceae bacterium]